MRKRVFFLFFLTMFVPACGGAELFLMPIAPIVQFYLIWKDGEAIKYYNVNTEIVYRAVKRNCENLGYNILEDDNDDEGRYYVVAKNDNKFKLKVQSVDNQTCVKLRINFMGDKPYAEMFFKELDGEIFTVRYDKDGNLR